MRKKQTYFSLIGAAFLFSQCPLFKKGIFRVTILKNNFNDLDASNFTYNSIPKTPEFPKLKWYLVCTVLLCYLWCPPLKNSHLGLDADYVQANEREEEGHQSASLHSAALFMRFSFFQNK
jgi:hypothetical protein